MAFAVASCAEDEIIENNNSGKPGDEVQFGLSLQNSRTIYGPEGASSFPIYWSQGDKILVASPQCSRKEAEYGVTPVSGQSYAEALTRTGDAGVQWGSTDADFYSIYPSTGASWDTISVDNVTAKLNISSMQSANLVLENGTYRAADMKNVIMYAREAGVKNGATANLQYTPYSTVLEFQLTIAANKDTEGNITDEWGSVKVMSMTLTAPVDTAIAGDFTLKFNGDNAPVITANGNNTNSIKMEFATQPMLDKTNQTLKAKLALIPISGIGNLDGWTVSFEVLEGTDTQTKIYKKKLDGIGKALAPGLIHKVTLPSISSETAWKPDMGAWITQLYDYKNIYLTELSLPGAWYAGAPTGDGYQATADMATLWKAGVRAFAVECRTATSGWSNSTPSRVVISGTGNNSTGITGGGRYYYGGTRISTVISNIVNAMNDEDFGVLILSYADGGTGGHRDADHNYFINGIKTEINDSGVATNIYSDEITSETTVEDVLGKLIIKINVDDNLAKSSYAGDANMFISYNPFLQQLKPAEGQTSVDYTQVLFSNMYFKEWDDTYKVTTAVNATDFLWCFSSANRTQQDTEKNTTIPTYAQRKTALGQMMEHSKEYAKSHNIWFYFNAGGTQTTSATDGTTSATSFATTMNSWLLKLIQLKANGGTDTEGIFGTANAYVESDPSPLGIVMFNQCTSATYNGPSIISEIVYMNNKAKLKRYNPNPNPDNNGQGGGPAIGG